MINKTFLMKNHLPLILISILFILQSCATTHRSVKVTYPPHLSLPENIKNIAVYNRTKTDSTKKDNNVVESVLTGEAIAGDLIGAEECLNSFVIEMNRYDSPHAFVPINHLLYRKDVNIHTPEPLQWQTVKTICRKNNCDALMVLETFDTNSDNIISTVFSGMNIVKSGGYIAPKQVNYSVTYSWRLYDTLSQTVFDQFGDQLQQTVGGLSPIDPVPTSAIRNTGNYIGDISAGRYLPVVVWQDRVIYKRGNEQLKVAWRKAVTNDWTGAMEKWNALSKSVNSKVAGRACFNMALGCEVTGKTDLAKTWAQKAFTDYKVRKARNYLEVLNSLPQ